MTNTPAELNAIAANDYTRKNTLAGGTFSTQLGSSSSRGLDYAAELVAEMHGYYNTYRSARDTVLDALKTPVIASEGNHQQKISTVYNASLMTPTQIR